MPGDSRLKPSTQRAFGSRKKRAWNKKAPATSAPSAAELESRPDPLDLPGTSTDDTVGPSSTSETLRVDAAYYSTAEQAQRVERSAQTKTVLSGKSATQRKFDLLGVSAECQTGDAGTDFLLVDMKVLNNFFAQAKCDKCDAKSLSVRKATDKEYGLAPQDEGYTDWLATHECQRNIECNSGRMEVEAALTMFQRSWAKHGLRYTTVLSDGDSRTFHALSEAEVYGFIQIDKKDCINHVHKRMGAALRNLVDKKKAQAMKRAVEATLLHMTSTDDAPKHSKCPEGASSWCKYNRALANGESPPSHKNALPACVGAALEPVFARLSDESLLARCCEGKTQNASESLHSVIWTQTSKNGNASLESVKRAAAEAVAIYNQGRRATNESIAASLGYIAGDCLRVLINLRLQQPTVINVRQAAEMLTGAWWSVTSTTIQNCWRKAGLMHTSEQPEDAEQPCNDDQAEEAILASFGVSDGASTNKAMWSSFGIKGKLHEPKHRVDHP
ncbi:hypothetical protein HPB52_015376 [Rhipicephalus sanguineus]|uniref:Mutator-like transposase domain-containing protein n=1 Tax=Rhipicephalus sanguineus TaxID=34632 RepID=A0A9D4PRW1_RHISA|nr:hypothetical protein HPB52_015376 [Rhipicephalus sanguineus]